MEVIFYFTLLLLASFSRGNEMLREEEAESDDKGEKEETIAFESFGAPVYGINNVLKPATPNGKSGYNTPVPALSPSYMSYLTSLGLGNPYAYGPYNRYGFLPYAYPSAYGYGAPLNNPAFNSAMLSGLGYASYGGPYFGRSVNPGLGYGFPAYNQGLGYRYGGLGYAAAALRGSPAPVPSPVLNVPAPVAGVPAPVSRAQVAALLPPVPAVPNAISGIPAPLPTALSYRAPLRPLQGKDGTVRYAYAPTDVQALPVY